MAIRRFIPSIAMAVTFLNFNCCKQKNTFAPPPPATVTVAKPMIRDQTVYTKFPASLEGISEIEIRARVKGILEKAFFDEGTEVTKGSDLFLIEQAPYLASVASSQADVAKAEAALRIANATLNRFQKAGSSAVSKLDIETAQAEVDNAEAVLAQSKSMLDRTQLDLSYTLIKSPIDGRIARSMVDVGNLVGNTEPTLLTRIVNEKSIRAYYNIPERMMLEYYRKRAEAKKDGGLHFNNVQLELADGTVYEHLGEIDFVDNKVNESTRTAQVRAIFPNLEGKLSSGLFARIGYPRTFKNAVLVPSFSILQDIGGSYVWVVDSKKKVTRRGIVTGETVLRSQKDSNAVPIRDTIVTAGLTKDDLVIVSGLQRVRQGAVVNPELSEDFTVKVEQPSELVPNDVK